MKNIVTVPISEEMESSYLDYAMSVIVARALPDVRDGLKPVHRRILYSMYDAGYHHTKPHKKCARIVGDVMGKYHPHGDQAIYDSLVRMAQDFSLRVPLIDGQGNFGSRDGDKAAQMRYTEARLAKISANMLGDIDKNTIDFRPNYDNSESEPTVLPAAIPNILINGSEGIAVGMATSIPNHNPTEVMDACIELLDNPEATVEDLMRFVKGPDYSTKGIALIGKGLKSAFESGRGSIKLRGRAEIDEFKKGRDRITVTEIPHHVLKSQFVESVAHLVRDKKIEGISDIRDESNKNGIHIVIELKKNVEGNVILNQLYKLTQLQTSVNYNMIALCDGVPRQVGLRDILEHFIDFKKEVVTRRTKFELSKAQEKAHLLIGLTVAIDHIDRVVDIIRSSESSKEAKQRLLEESWSVTEGGEKGETVVSLVDLVQDKRNKLEGGNFQFTQVQVDAILEMRLSKLTGLERGNLVSNLKDLGEIITRCIEILSNNDTFLALIRSELAEMRELYKTERLTEIAPDDSEDFSIEDFIQKEDILISFTLKNYIQRESVSTYESQKRGGKGRKTIKVGDDDCVTSVISATTHSDILFFTDNGRVYELKAYRIPIGSSNSKGRAIVNLINLSPEEKIQKILVLPTEIDHDNSSLIFSTKSGLIRKSQIQDFQNIKSNGKIAISLAENDELVNVQIAEETNNILLSTALGKACRFKVSDLRVIKSRNSSGVIGVSLENSDYVVGMCVISDTDKDNEFRDQFLTIPVSKRKLLANGEKVRLSNIDADMAKYWAENEQFLLTITLLGYGKCSSTYEYRTTSRGSKGVKNIITSNRNGNVVSSFIVGQNEDIIILSSAGRMVRISSSDVSVIGRVTQGVRLITMNKDEHVVYVTKIASQIEEEENETPEDTLI